MRSTFLLLLLGFAMVMAACKGPEASPEPEAPPPTSVPQTPIGEAAVLEQSLGQALQPAAVEELSEAPYPLAPEPAAERPEKPMAETSSLPVEIKSVQAKKREISIADREALAKQRGEIPLEKVISRDFDLVERTKAMFQRYGLTFDAGQEKKLHSIASGYDFSILPPGEQRQALRRQFMSEVFDKVLTRAQQDIVNEKRALGGRE